MSLFKSSSFKRSNSGDLSKEQQSSAKYFEGNLFSQIDLEEHTLDAKNWNTSLVAPLLTKLALFPFYISSTDSTLTELTPLLNISRGTTFNHQLSLMRHAQDLAREESEIVNQVLLFVSKSCETSPEFESYIQKCFKVKIVKIDFANSNELDEHKDKLLVHDIYHKIVTNNLTAAALCTSFHLSTLEWSTKFVTKQTVQNYKFINVFSEDKKAALCNVDMLCRKDAKELYGIHKWPVTQNSAGYVQFYSLTLMLRPGNCRITFILPEGASRNLYSEILDAFETTEMDVMTKLMEDAKEKTLDIYVPKCRIKDEHAIDLHNLKMFSGTSLFNSNKKSKCTGLTENDAFHLTYFTQYITSLHMDEHGIHGDRKMPFSAREIKEVDNSSTASSSSSSLFGKKKTEFIMNRPFFFILSHTDGNIFLMGRVNKP